jgi:type I restriction enzyme S subunit
MSKMKFADLLIKKDGIIKGPFGGDIKKSLFVSRSDSTYKVYEQSVVLSRDVHCGTYYIDESYFKKKLCRFEVRPGDVLVTGAGTLGELFVIPPNAPKGVINQALIRIRLNESIVNKKYFLYYFKQYIKKVICDINGDSVIPNLPPLPKIRDTDIDIPNKKEQEKAAAVLSSLDTKIELNNKICSELESLAQDLYHYWFTQFDFPDEKGRPYGSSGGKMVWNEELGRQIPKGWEVKRLTSVVTIVLGGTPDTKKPAYWENGDINWLSSGEIATFPVLEADAKITKEAIENSATVLLKTGSVALSITRYIRPTILGIDACINQSVVGIEESGKYKHSFLYPFIKSQISRYMGLRTGAMQPHINKKTVEETLIACPSDRVLHEYYKNADIAFAQIMTIARESLELARLRDFLLPLLMNGQVKVR